MRKSLITFLVLTLLLSAFAFAEPEKGIFEVSKSGDYTIVYTTRELFPGPRQSFYRYTGCGVIDADGNFVVEPVYASINPHKNGRALFKAENGRYGFFDEEWNIVVEPVYRGAGEFYDGRAAVTNENYAGGYIDKDGNVVIPLIYDSVYNFVDGKAWVGKGTFYDHSRSPHTMFGEIDVNGNIVKPIKFHHNDEFDILMSENNISINGKVYKNSDFEYPYINNLGYTYIPLTWYGCRELGFSCAWSEETGLVISGTPEEKGNVLGKNSFENGKFYKAQLYTGTITIDGVKYTTDDAYYPILTYNDVVYFPILWKQGLDALGLSYSYDFDNNAIVLKKNG